MTFYISESMREGAFHLANSAPAYIEDVLIVFVHGIRSTWKDTFRVAADQDVDTQNASELILRHAQLDADVLMFAHPSKIWQSASIEQSAKLLAQQIENAGSRRVMATGGTVSPRYRHLIFICHSLGGLVVKRLLLDDYERHGKSFEPANLVSGSWADHSLWYRTRAVINIDTPHAGGRRSLYYPLYPITIFLRIMARLWSFLDIFWRHTRHGDWWEWGWNHMIEQLWPNNSMLQKLESEFGKAEEELDKHFLPSPIRKDFYAVVRDAIGKPRIIESNREDAAQRTSSEGLLPSNHGLAVKLAAPDCGMVIQELFSNSPAHRLVERTLVRLSFEPRLRVDSLLGPEQNPKTQLGVLARVQRSIKEDEPGSRIIVIEAEAGVGKSAVVRMLTRLNGIAWLRGSSGRVLPVLIALGGKVSVSVPTPPSNSAAELWDWMLKLFVQSIHDICNSTILTIEWLKNYLRDNRSLVILDGLEEFLMNYPHISRALVLKLPFVVLSQFDRSRIVVTVRKTFFSEQERNELAGTFLRLNLDRSPDEELTKHFPGSGRLLSDHANNGMAAKLLRTPLILKLLEPSGYSSPASLKSEADVFEHALLQIAKYSGLPPEVAASCWLDWMRVCGWIAFSQFGSALTINEFIEGRGEGKGVSGIVGARRRRNDWRVHLRDLSEWGDFDKDEFLFRDLDRAQIREIFRRTVFITRSGVGSDESKSEDSRPARVMHREIEDYLAASYLGRCIQFRKLDEYRERGGTVRVFRLAAQFLDRIQEDWGNEKQIFGKDLVEAAIEQTYSRRHRMIIGTVAAIVAHAQQSPPEEFFDAMLVVLKEQRMDPLVRHIAVSGMGYRSLKLPQSGLKAKLVEEFKAFAKDTTHNPVSRSMAWCYCKALGGGEPFPYRNLDLSPTSMEKSVRPVFFGDPAPDHFDQDNLVPSFQVGLGDLLHDLAKVPDVYLKISVVHYLLGVSSKSKALNDTLREGLIRGINEALPQIQDLMELDVYPELASVLALARSRL